MKIELMIDEQGEPYLSLLSQKDYGRKPIEDQLLSRFISLAREKGIVMRNEDSFEHSSDYATVRIIQTTLPTKRKL